MYQSGTPAARISSSAPSGRPRPFRTDSMILNERLGGIPLEIRNSIMSSRQPTHSDTPPVPLMIISLALPSHTSVPWVKPEIRSSISNWVGCVSSSTPRVNLVLNSGTATAPVGPNTLSFSNPRTLDEVNSDMVSGSSSGISLAFTPVRSSSIRTIVGSSCPSISSLSRLDSMEWYSK